MSSEAESGSVDRRLLRPLGDEIACGMTDSDATMAATAILNRCFRLLDEKAFDVDRFAGVFATDGVILRPNGTSMVGPTEIVESHRKSFARFAVTQHLLTGHDVEPDGDGVTIRANLVAMHLWGENPQGVVAKPDDFFIAGAVITATLVPAASSWRISRLTNTNVWKGGSGFASMAATLGKP